MKLCDVNPFIRFACVIRYQSSGRFVNVMDCRLFFVVSGEMKIDIENREYIVKEGESFYCPAGSIYKASSPEGCIIAMTNFDLTRNRTEISECYPPVNFTQGIPIFENTEVVEDCDFLNHALFMDFDPLINNKINAIIREFSEKKFFYREKSSSVMKGLVVDICRGEQKKIDSSFDTIETVITYINANYGTKLSNKELAELVGYHEYYLNRLFLKHTGKTMHSYITDVRLAESKKMLINTDMSLCRIAEAAGFNNSSHFAACFRAKFGYTPSYYKRNTKNKI